MERLQVNGNSWSETSSDNNKDDSVTNRKTKSEASDGTQRLKRRSMDMTDKRRYIHIKTIFLFKNTVKLE